jgi:hypothetical protein
MEAKFNLLVAAYFSVSFRHSDICNEFSQMFFIKKDVDTYTLMQPYVLSYTSS